MSAATQNEMERLRKERDKAINDRDTARRDYEVMNNIREGVEQDLEAALEREQALAAKFVAMQDAATDLIHASNEEEAGDAMERIAECGDKHEREILAKHILIKQAEALEGMADENFISSDSLYRRASELRQQAEAQDD